MRLIRSLPKEYANVPRKLELHTKKRINMLSTIVYIQTYKLTPNILKILIKLILNSFSEVITLMLSGKAFHYLVAV